MKKGENEGFSFEKHKFVSLQDAPYVVQKISRILKYLFKYL